MKYFQLAFRAMGTPCEVQLYGPGRAQTKRIAAMVIADVERLESIYSRYRDSSLLTKINQVAAIGGDIRVDPETAGLLDYAQVCFQQSDGLFDVTSGILRQAWNFKSVRLPESGAIDALLDRVGWQRLQWNPPILSFPSSGMEIDLGGVVKEYAVDRAAAICLEQGINHGIVNLGGDIRIIGPHPDGSPWRIAIRNPGRKAGTATELETSAATNNTGSPLQILELHKGALASSGDYERCITLEGVRYGHILNPLTGWPVKYMAAVSVSADLCVVAGSAATIGMLKEEAGKKWLEELGLPHLWVGVNGTVGGSLNAG